MSKWIEENNDHILEGHGAKFVVGRVLYSKQLPSKWTIKQSPFLLDVHKKFATLGEAKEYCEQRYQELFGKLDEITRLRADLAAALAECERLNKSRNRWGKKYNDCLGKLRLAVMSDSDECKELTAQNNNLRADLAAVTEERDRMREVIKGINAMLEISCETLERPTYDSLEVGQRHNPLSQKEIIQRLTETCLFVRADLSKLMDEARAALEGVTEKAGAGNE